MASSTEERGDPTTIRLGRMMFHFNDQPALAVQCDSTCQEMMDHFSKVLEEDIPCLFPDLVGLLKKCSTLWNDIYRMEWMAKYGCALVIRNSDAMSDTVTLIGLDGWTSKVHASVANGREMTAEADIVNPATLFSGKVKKVALESLMQSFHEGLNKAQSSQRSQQKHHWTPSFVWARLIDAFVETEALTSTHASKSCYQGGTTDVGLHTGCLRRNTSFPLVLSVCSKVLAMNGDIDHKEFFKFLVVYYLHHLRHIVMDTPSYEPRKIDSGIIIVREIERFLFLVGDEDYDAEVVQQVKLHHAHLVSLKPRITEELRSIPSIVSVEDECRDIRPSGFPDLSELTLSTERSVSASDEAERNLHWSNLSVYDISSTDTQDAWVALGRLNRVFWKCASALVDKRARRTMANIKVLLREQSRATAVALQTARGRTDIMSVELRSCEMLSTWIAFCWAHRLAVEQYHFFTDFSAALDPADLQFLVLQDADAREAADFVQNFLCLHRKNPMFPFRNHEHTLRLASVAGNSLSALQAFFTTEEKAAQVKLDGRYKRIVEAQERLRVLDPELTKAKSELRAATAAFEHSKNHDYTYRPFPRTKIFGRSYYTNQTKMNAAKTRVSTLESEIRSWESPPSDVFFPLPSSRNTALEWLFFLFMPPEFTDIVALAHRGQLQLWEKVPPHGKWHQDLAIWFNKYKRSSQSASLPTEMILGSSTSVQQSPLAKDVNIRNYGRTTGTFYPDSYKVCPAWQNSDPFASPLDIPRTAALFTETLPKIGHFLVMVPEPSKARGNEGIASKHQKPDWLTHEEYHMFTTMRAFPNLQIRQLLVAMEDSRLPFEHESVRILIKQVLFHLGKKEWRKDLEEQDAFQRIADQLTKNARILEQSPNNSGKLLLFGIVSSYCGQYSELCLSSSRDYSRIARQLADEVDIEVRNLEVVSPDVYWKQAKLYAAAILSHSFCDNERDVLLSLVESIVLYKNKIQFASTLQCSNELEATIASEMAKRIGDVIETVSGEPSQLTKCLRLIVDGAPSKLEWHKIEYGAAADTACFEAMSDHHYSMNVLNGIVLVDGVPPGFLPDSILNNALYRRTFGHRNFECVVEGVSHFRTSRRIDDSFLYEFKQDGNHLKIVECASVMTPKGIISEKLLLLPQDTLSLPTLLSKPYSHWYSTTSEAIVIRGAFYKLRAVKFVMTRNAVYRVPMEDASLGTHELMARLPEYDRLVMSPPKALQLLGRIENPNFIMVWADNKQSRLQYLLPRLNLEFQQTQEAVASINFSGFSLRASQVLNNTLPGLISYLVLADKRGNEKVLIPAGSVRINGNITVPDDPNGWDRKARCHIYDVHRRFCHLIAKNAVGRFQLAAMYAATSCYTLPNMMRAVTLTRHSWTNEELDDQAKAKLIEVSKYSNLSASLRLMCTWIWTCSNRLQFLREYPNDNEGSSSCVELELDPLAAREYQDDKYSQKLLHSEVYYLLSIDQGAEEMSNSAELPRSVEAYRFVEACEENLAKKMLTSSKKAECQFPLDFPSNTAGLEKIINDDLKSSWLDYSSLTEFQIEYDSKCCRAIQSRVKARRYRLESQLMESLNASTGPHHDLSVISGALSSVTPWEFLTLAINVSRFQIVNPFLRRSQIAKIRSKIVDWMLLCVLEDKISRIMEASTDHQILVELQAVRTWQPQKHLMWIVFEVEQRLQIRPYQYSIVRQLLESPSSMIQLNMGLGKTSVLVPMLILEISSLKNDLVRINMLASIISVASDIYKSILTASALHVRIFLLPYQRNFPLGESTEPVISEEMELCRDGNGCMLVTPQHRNSLVLKQHDGAVKVQGLSISAVDVIDESDAILDSSFQLVYALGEQQQLPDGETRWKMIETFISLLVESSTPQIEALRKDLDALHREPCRAGDFPKLRLLSGSELHELEVGKALCRELIRKPPNEFCWMARVKGRKHKRLVQLMSDRDISAFGLIEEDQTFKAHKSDILAARGCIAWGVLFHCLRPRHRVKYGIERARRKMAIPFLAADTPNLRADYSHPDVMIVYTCLSYYHEGLTERDLEEALRHLQTLGPTAQESIYESWVESVRENYTEGEELLKFDSIRKVDVENKVQLKLMHRAFRYCMKVISFWMNNFVFPLETHVFPQRRVTSAWNLVDSEKSRGFSGTDDNRFSQPTLVKQIPQDVPELRATNGEMVDRILTSTRDVRLLDDSDCILWRVILEECGGPNIHCLIDVGGLMAGVSPKKVAIELAEIISHDEFRGVVYFDTLSERWNVLQFKGQIHESLQTASLRENECFVYYDESRCRGSDLKLKPDACALVTLEPSLTKDRFLQGCARLRQLREHGQSIILAGTRESLTPGDTAKDVLERTIQNTVAKNKKRIIELFERGSDYFRFPEAMDMEVDLDSMYGSEVARHNSVAAYFEATFEVEESLSPSMQEKKQHLISHCLQNGDGIEVQVSQLGEECERELENEEEEEAEEEVECLSAMAFAERDWSFHNVFSKGAKPDIKILTTSELARPLLGQQIGNIVWSRKLLCTLNWRNTVQSMGPLYLRPVNAFLAYPDGTVVLISDYEADKLLPYWWNAVDPEVKLGHLTLANAGIWLGGDKVTLSVDVLTSAKLFAGQVQFGGAQTTKLNDLFARTPAPRPAILELLGLRHRLRFLERSDLDVFSLSE